MSRIGNAPIKLPQGVEFSVAEDNVVTVKGPKGELQQEVDKAIKVKLEEGVVTLERPTEQKRHKALHGLYRALLNNMVVGVSEGYKIEQELVGVGYRANLKGNLLELSLGYSHPIVLQLPEEVKCETKAEKGKACTVGGSGFRILPQTVTPKS